MSIQDEYVPGQGIQYDIVGRQREIVALRAQRDALAAALRAVVFHYGVDACECIRTAEAALRAVEE